MVDKDGYLCLGDYGLVDVPGIRDKHGSRSYWAPEVINEEEQGYYSDWWSVGVTLIQCSSGRHPFMRRFVRPEGSDLPAPPWDESKVDAKADPFIAPNESDMELEDLDYGKQQQHTYSNSTRTRQQRHSSLTAHRPSLQHYKVRCTSRSS